MSTPKYQKELVTILRSPLGGFALSRFSPGYGGMVYEDAGRLKERCRASPDAPISLRAPNRRRSAVDSCNSDHLEKRSSSRSSSTRIASARCDLNRRQPPPTMKRPKLHPFVDNMIPEPDDWSDRSDPSHSYSSFGYEPTRIIGPEFRDELYSNADEVASLTPNVHEPPNEVAAQSRSIPNRASRHRAAMPRSQSRNFRRRRRSNRLPERAGIRERRSRRRGLATCLATCFGRLRWISGL